MSAQCYAHCTLLNANFTPQTTCCTQQTKTFYTVGHWWSSREVCRVRKAVSREWVGSECELTVSGGHSTDRSHQHHQSTYTTRHRFYFGNQFHLGTSLPSSTGGIGGDYAQVPGGLSEAISGWLTGSPLTTSRGAKYTLYNTRCYFWLEVHPSHPSGAFRPCDPRR